MGIKMKVHGRVSPWLRVRRARRKAGRRASRYPFALPNIRFGAGSWHVFGVRFNCEDGNRKRRHEQPWRPIPAGHGDERHRLIASLDAQPSGRLDAGTTTRVCGERYDGESSARTSTKWVTPDDPTKVLWEPSMGAMFRVPCSLSPRLRHQRESDYAHARRFIGLGCWL